MSYRTMRRTAWQRVAWSHPWLVLFAGPIVALSAGWLFLLWIYTSVPHVLLAALCSGGGVGLGAWVIWKRPPVLRSVLLFAAALALAVAAIVLTKGS